MNSSTIGVNRMNHKWRLLLLLLLFVGCAHKKTATIVRSTFTDNNLPANIYLVQDIKTSIDSIFVYYQHAINSLDFQDTIGAKIYFEKAFNVISNFDESTKAVLMDWSAYDSLIHNINDDYKEVNPYFVMDQEAEEVREELTNMEEEAFGDMTDSAFVEVETDSDFYMIPIQVNRRVELAMKYFQTKGRKVFQLWLERSGRYEDLIKRVLRESGLPKNLFYLAMIESGFNPSAYSYARASGLWQFIYSTGNYYGLRSNWWFDERRDPLLSTQAAAKHLKDLYDRFGDWYLAMAGYNCNPKKIESRMRQYNTRDFWKLKRLPRQTRNYIPTFLAAQIIAGNPKKYGFYVEKMNPIEYDTVKISECVDLSIIAECVNSSFEEIKSLNPAMRRWCTPPGIKDFVVNIPKGKQEEFWLNYNRVPDEKKISWLRHKVRSGETLSTIASKYGTTVTTIKNQNNIRSSLIRIGQYLVIPVPQNKNYYSSDNSYVTRSVKSKPKKINDIKGHKKIAYIVKKGDTLGEIAENYNTRASRIRAWNGLYYGEHIYPNQKLNIWIPESLGMVVHSNQREESIPEGTIHIVKRGDTLWDIARRYDVSIEKIKSWNNMNSSKIKPGERLRIKQSSGG